MSYYKKGNGKVVHKCMHCGDASYYKKDFETMDYITANEMNFSEGNVIKYVTRYKEKGGLEDLHKAKYYLDALVEAEKMNEKMNKV